MHVHCRCENHNRCARCGEQLAKRRLNANYYRESDRQIWHVGTRRVIRICAAVYSIRPLPGDLSRCAVRTRAATDPARTDFLPS
jgi:hypothetical protein